MKVAICICTCKRPESLMNTLSGVSRLEFKSVKPHITIIVVDNDPARSAQQAYQKFAQSSAWPVHYYCEAKQGIPFARNTCLQHGQHNDFIAFIDDDEEPEPCWLEKLLETIEKFHTPIATGPVLRKFPPETPQWIIRGKYFDPLVLEEGTELSEAYTGNVLFKTEILRMVTPWFDERMALTGGSDSHFFRRLSLAGHKIVWAADAVVYETVPSGRLSAKWLLQRSFRLGCMMTFIRIDLMSYQKAWFVTIAGVCFAGMKGIVKTIVGLVLGRHILIAGLRHFYYAAGLINGLGGKQYQEYSRIYGE